MIERKGKFNTKIITSIVFLIILFILFVGNLSLIYGLFKQELKAVVVPDRRSEFMMPEEIEAAYNDNFYKKMFFIDINGLAHKTIGQKIVNGAIKDNNGQLNLEDNTLYKFNKREESEKSEKAIEILEFARENGADVIYVQRPWKNSENSEVFPYGIELQYGQQFDFWCNKMMESDIPVLDLRKEMDSDELVFYKTDHHWTTKSSLIAAGRIVNVLNSIYDLQLNETLVDEKNYNSKIYHNCFLGSEGIKTGQYYVGKDDFEVLWPDFETDLSYDRYDNEGLVEVKKGNFSDAFISMDLIEDKEYNNKYSAYMFDGFVENRIDNKMSDNDLKALLISDSFSRPMAPFFSLCFKETRYLDPQEGRYTSSYVKYIENYKPDIVVLMFPGDGTFEEI